MQSQKIKGTANRQAATCNGLNIRVRDLGFDEVGDPRVAGKVKYSLPTMLTALVAAMVTMARSLRMVEQRTGQMSRKHDEWMGVGERIADNTFGKVLPRLAQGELMGCLHRLVNAEHRRGNLKPTRLPWGTVAIDGKNVATLHWPDMLRVLGLEPQKTTVEQGVKLFAEQYPLAQVCTREGGTPYALMRVCILAMARKLSRHGYSQEPPSWGQVAEHFLLELCGSILETKAFDTV